jgi:hypothetical protein
VAHRYVLKGFYNYFPFSNLNFRIRNPVSEENIFSNNFLTELVSMVSEQLPNNTCVCVLSFGIPHNFVATKTAIGEVSLINFSTPLNYVISTP